MKLLKESNIILQQFSGKEFASKFCDSVLTGKFIQVSERVAQFNLFHASSQTLLEEWCSERFWFQEWPLQHKLIHYRETPSKYDWCKSNIQISSLKKKNS